MTQKIKPFKIDEDEEIDIVGEYDKLCSRNEEEISNISSGQLLSCDFTVHPRWLTDHNLCPDNLPTQGSQDAIEQVQDEVVIEEPAPMDFDFAEDLSNSDFLFTDQDIPTVVEEEVVTNVDETDDKKTKTEKIYYKSTKFQPKFNDRCVIAPTNPRSLLKTNILIGPSRTNVKFKQTLLVNQSVLKGHSIQMPLIKKSTETPSPKSISERPKRSNSIKQSRGNNTKSVQPDKHLISGKGKDRGKKSTRNGDRNDSEDGRRGGKYHRKSSGKKLIDLHGENITINHDVDTDTHSNRQQVDGDGIISTAPLSKKLEDSGSDVDVDVDIESDIITEQILPIESVTSQPIEPNRNKSPVTIEKPAVPLNHRLLRRYDLTKYSPELKQQLYDQQPPTEECQFDRSRVTEIERYFHYEFFEGRPTKTPERYLKIRNFIIDAWRDMCPQYVTKTSVRAGLKNCGDVNCISRIHCLLEQLAVINIGHCPEHFQYVRPLIDLNKQLYETAKKSVDLSEPGNGLSMTKRYRQKSENALSGKAIPDANYTVSHANGRSEIIYSVASRTKDDEPKRTLQPMIQPEYRLIQCRRFSNEQSAPFRIDINISTFICLLLHSLSSTDEIMGFLGGRYQSKQINLTRYSPCRTSAQSGTMCEMCPVSQVEQSEQLRRDGYQLLGWFHSHPTFPAIPSAIDVTSQAEMQIQFSEMHNRMFVGLIFSCTDLQLKCMYIMADDLMDVSSDTVPYELDINVIGNIKNVFVELRDVLDVIPNRQSDEFSLVTSKFNSVINPLLESHGFGIEIKDLINNLIKS